MNRSLRRLVVALGLFLLLTVPGGTLGPVTAPARAAGPQRVPATGARVSPKTKITLTAEKHAGLAAVTADLREAVSFSAHWAGKLSKGEFIAILSGKTLVGRPCTYSPCPGIESSDTQVTRKFVAEVYTRQQVIAKSNVIDVEWKDLTLNLSVVSDVTGTIEDLQTDPASVSQLRGVPLQLSASAPEGFATSWKKVEIVDVQTGSSLYTFAPGGPKQFVDNVALLDERLFIVRAIDAAGHEAKLSKPITVKPRDWKVDIEAAGKTGSAGGQSLTVGLGEEVQITAVITEPNAQQLAKYADTVVYSNAGNDLLEKNEKECAHAWTCPVTVSRSTADSVPFEGGVVVLDPQNNMVPAGLSTDATVVWGSPVPLGIVYRVTGGSDPLCQPPASQSGPVDGLVGCNPKKGATVQLTAWAVQPDPSQLTAGTAIDLPAGDHIQWYRHDTSGNPEQFDPCTASPCVRTAHDTGTGSADFFAAILNQQQQPVASDYIHLNVFWE